MSKILKSVIKDIIKGNTSLAKASLHEYIVAKTQEVSGLTEGAAPKNVDEDVVHVDFGKKKDLSKDDAAIISRATGTKVTTNGKDISTGAKEISMAHAFGSRELAALEDAGIKITEKPSYWEDFEGNGYAVKNNIHQIKLKRIEKTIGKIKVYDGDELFQNGGVKPKGPLVSPKIMPKESMFIVKFPDGTKYLCDLTGASTYIRNWQKID